jgi:hypothetical protein
MKLPDRQAVLSPSEGGKMPVDGPFLGVSRLRKLV